MTVTAHTKPAHDQASPNPSMDGGRREAHEVPPLAEELLAVGDCWGRQTRFSSKKSGLYETTHALVAFPTTMNIQNALSELQIFCLFIKHENRRKCGCGR